MSVAKCKANEIQNKINQLKLNVSSKGDGTIDLRLNNTQFNYDENRFSIKEGSFLYDTYRYYIAK
jgi:hypothetical protein